MAFRDYITCGECETKIIYDGYDDGRNRLEEIWGDPNANSWTVHLLCPDCIKKMRADLAAARSNEQQLRHLLFLAHGNAEHYLYGDDGERFCNTCMIDFNADSPTEIERKIMAHWAKKQRIDAALREGEK